MRKLIVCGLFVCLFTVAGFAVDVGYNYDSEANFATYKTYKWVQIKGAEKLDDLNDSQIKGAIDGELAKKGLRKVDTDDADLYIGIQPSVSSEKQYTSFNDGWGYGPGWRYGGMGGISTGTTSTIMIGHLAVDMYDSKAKKLVWRGTATDTLDPKRSPEKRVKNYQKGAAKLFKKFPPVEKK